MIDLENLELSHWLKDGFLHAWNCRYSVDAAASSCYQCRERVRANYFRFFSNLVHHVQPCSQSEFRLELIYQRRVPHACGVRS